MSLIQVSVTSITRTVVLQQLFRFMSNVNWDGDWFGNISPQAAMGFTAQQKDAPGGLLKFQNDKRLLGKQANMFVKCADMTLTFKQRKGSIQTRAQWCKTWLRADIL